MIRSDANVFIHMKTAHLGPRQALYAREGCKSFKLRSSSSEDYSNRIAGGGRLGQRDGRGLRSPKSSRGAGRMDFDLQKSSAKMLRFNLTFGQ
jgi:hypothetical protein